MASFGFQPALEFALCIRAHARPELLPAALVLTLVAGLTADGALDRAAARSGNTRFAWLTLVGVGLCGGTWGAHHIALIGYLGPELASFRPASTLAALLLVFCSSLASMTLLLRFPGPGGRLAAAVTFGGGVVLMHFTAMSGLNLPVRPHLDLRWTIAAYVVATVFAWFSATCSARPRTRLNRAGTVLGYAMTVCATHLTAMVGVRLRPEPRMLDAHPITAGDVVEAVGIIVLAVFSIAMLIGIANRRASAARKSAELQFSLLMTGTSDYAICMLDERGRVSHWNAGATRLMGYDMAEAVGMPFALMFSVQDRIDDTPATILRTVRTEGLCHGTWLCERRDGSQFWSQGAIESVCDEHGRSLGFSFITHDITDIKAASDRARESRRLLDTALGCMHHGVCMFDADERLLLANDAFYRIWSIEPATCQPGITLEQIAKAGMITADGLPMADEGLAQLRHVKREAVAEGNAPSVVLELRSDLILSVTDRPIPGGGWISVFEDITAQRHSESTIQHMALHDALTGLPNRTRFYRHFDAMIAEAGADGTLLAAIAIDLDRFKEINDTCGHATGDLLLQTIAERMSDCLADGEEVARFGGDEFAAAKAFTDLAELERFIDRLRACIIAPIEGHSGTMSVGASLGIAIYPADGTDRDTLLNNADLAMYRAKGQITSHVCFFEPGMDETARARRQLANDLRFAIERGELALLYQPQRSLRSGALAGYEALLRWHHPQRGLVPPDEFIPIAEETGEIFAIGEWVLREACMEACTWDPLLKVAVNLSPVQFLRDGLVDRVREIIIDSGISPHRLELEITETAIITDKLRALHCLRQFKAMGISVAIDDFGTGYSSLDTLHSFPFDKIKIDKSFLARAEHSGQARAIIRAVLALGKSLSIPVLAEGLETEQQLKVLEKEGCDEAQGYYFGRPALPPSSIRRNAYKA